MPRKLIRKLMPDERRLRNHRHLGWLGRHLHNPNIWHLTRESVARAFLVGLFCAFLPIPGQVLVAALIAILISSNLPISVGLVFITNPLTMPPIFYFCYRVGSWVLGIDRSVATEHGWNLHTLQAELASIWWPLLLGSLICGVVSGLGGYVLIHRFWIWHVHKSWRQRARSRTPDRHRDES
ncbi:MAG: DUF2062 domain-containing protein [Pseudomonadota bacterium]|jgi:uncharacterized protein (DUF2062 family)|nr:DUF2062 domain-containing protein [Pseudomonadota bacterium]